MSAGAPCRWVGVGLLALVPSACALAGYDFGDYERAAVNSAPAGAAGEANATNPFSTSLSSSGAASEGEGKGKGGAAPSLPSEGEGGAGAAPSLPTVEPTCAPRSCFALGLECGPIPEGEGCGQLPPPDCGGCFWWFQECRQNRCVIPE